MIDPYRMTRAEKVRYASGAWLLGSEVPEVDGEATEGCGESDLGEGQPPSDPTQP